MYGGIKSSALKGGLNYFTFVGATVILTGFSMCKRRHFLMHKEIIISDEVAKFLVGKGIDENILSVPQKVISSPLGPMLK